MDEGALVIALLGAIVGSISTAFSSHTFQAWNARRTSYGRMLRERFLPIYDALTPRMMDLTAIWEECLGEEQPLQGKHFEYRDDTAFANIIGHLRDYEYEGTTEDCSNDDCDNNSCPEEFGGCLTNKEAALAVLSGEASAVLNDFARAGKDMLPLLREAEMSGMPLSILTAMRSLQENLAGCEDIGLVGRELAFIERGPEGTRPYTVPFFETDEEVWDEVKKLPLAVWDDMEFLYGKAVQFSSHEPIALRVLRAIWGWVSSIVNWPCSVARRWFGEHDSTSEMFETISWHVARRLWRSRVTLIQPSNYYAFRTALEFHGARITSISESGEKIAVRYKYRRTAEESLGRYTNRWF